MFRTHPKANQRVILCPNSLDRPKKIPKKRDSVPKGSHGSLNLRRKIQKTWNLQNREKNYKLNRRTNRNKNVKHHNNPCRVKACGGPFKGSKKNFSESRLTGEKNEKIYKPRGGKKNES